MKLSLEQKTFSQSFTVFSNSRLNLNNFEKKYNLHRDCISKITDSENVVR